MEKVIDFLTVHRDVALATVDGDQPRVRAFQIMQVEGRDLYFATSEEKDVYLQLKQNPHMELLALTSDLAVRARGEARFDVPDERGRVIWEQSAVLQRIYGNYRDLAYFRMRIERADYYTLRTTPPILQTYQ